MEQDQNNSKSAPDAQWKPKSERPRTDINFTGIYGVYVALTVLLFVGLVLMAVFAKQNGWIPTR